RHLRVGTLLEGSVRKVEDRLRVSVHLVETATGYHRWSQDFDRRMEDALAIQDEIAQSVAASLSGRLRENPALPRTGAEAYEYYLRGRQFLPRMTQPELEKSASSFEPALHLAAPSAPPSPCLSTPYR